MTEGNDKSGGPLASRKYKPQQARTPVQSLKSNSASS
jgi:hypothetical protein